VASEEEKKQQDDLKGFAGLSLMVSDVDTKQLQRLEIESQNLVRRRNHCLNPLLPTSQEILPPMSKELTTPSTAKAEPAAAATTGVGRPSQQPSPPLPWLLLTSQEPAQQTSSGSSGGKWLLGIAAVIGVLWMIGQSDKNTTSPAPIYSPPAQLADDVENKWWEKDPLADDVENKWWEKYPLADDVENKWWEKYPLADDVENKETTLEPVAETQQNATPNYSPPPAEPQAQSRLQESTPPVGQNQVLSMAQIRYCLAENIRIDGAESAINNYIKSDVDRFNAMVADYNSRCGKFRYRSGTLESARRDIEPYRSQFQSEGRSKFARPSAGSPSSPAPARPALDATVQAVQLKLNELGYNAGTPDGLMGSGTRSAIVAFQRASGLAATGIADQTLLIQLQLAPALSTDDWYANDPVVQEAPTRSATTAPLLAPPSPSAKRSGPPANSYVSGSNWYCKEGFRKAGDRCVSVFQK
jgi:hypothetical protein